MLNNFFQILLSDFWMMTLTNDEKALKTNWNTIFKFVEKSDANLNHFQSKKLLLKLEKEAYRPSDYEAFYDKI